MSALRIPVGQCKLLIYSPGRLEAAHAALWRINKQTDKATCFLTKPRWKNARNTALCEPRNYAIS